MAMEITRNALENLMNSYVEHKKIMIEFENEDDIENAEYTFHQGCCETAENWMRAVGVSSQCNYIVERLWSK